MDAPRYEKYGRFWAVYDGAGLLVCVAVYRKGAREVVSRLTPPAPEGPGAFPPSPTAASLQPRRKETSRRKGRW